MYKSLTLTGEAFLFGDTSVCNNNPYPGFAVYILLKLYWKAKSPLKL